MMLIVSGMPMNNLVNMIIIYRSIIVEMRINTVGSFYFFLEVLGRNESLMFGNLMMSKIPTHWFVFMKIPELKQMLVEK